MLLQNAHIDNNFLQNGDLEEKMSLGPFLQYLENNKSAHASGMLLPKFAKELIQSKMAVLGDLNDENLKEYQEVFEVIYHLAKGVPTETHMNWALGYPIPDRVFCGTEAFYELITDDFTRISPPVSHHFLELEFINKQLLLLILERFYDVPPLKNKDRYVKRDLAFNRYFELDLDFTFVKIKPIGKLPELDLHSLKGKDNIEFKDIEPIIQRFDLRNFLFEGFTILTFSDCQESYTSEQLQDLVNNISIYTGKNGLDKLNTILGDIMAFKGVKSSFYPILKLNDIPILSPDLAQNSILFHQDVFYSEEAQTGELLAYLDKPTVLAFGIADNLDSESSKLLERIKNTGLHSYVCFPLLQQGRLVAIMELYSYNGVQLNRKMLVQIRNYYGLLTQLANNILSAFKSELNDVILHQYTALQPAVEWKFNQVAAAYMGDVMDQIENPTLEKIVFPNVYPFYAAVDVKDSSLLRTKSYHNDIQLRVNYVKSLIARLQETHPSLLKKSFLDRFAEVEQWTNEYDLDNYLLDILAFFQEDIPAFLDSLSDLEKDFEQPLYACRQKLKYSYEDVHSSNGAFERSLQKINQLLKMEMDNFNQSVQAIIPSYFETFRTDGIEYDLYVGQSIAPRNDFKSSMLKKIRKEQIANIARIGQLADRMKQELPIPLETTQLIFIHPNPIDISFRDDERRFDVEGSYNIRYQIIKKRIDKVKILDSEERLVKPGYIAIVFNRNQVVRDLKSCLKEVAEMGFIESDIEEIRLEKLQGISDLKALRVKIKLD